MVGSSHSTVTGFRWRTSSSTCIASGVFYLVAATAVILLIGSQVLARATRRTAVGLGPVLAVCGMLLSWRLWTGYAHADLAGYPGGPLNWARDDLPMVPAYRWIKANTPAKSLFLVEPPTRRAGAGELASLFGIVARRRNVYTQRLYGEAIPQADYEAAHSVYHGTFGESSRIRTSAPGPTNVAPQAYAKAYARWRPDYIIPRRSKGPQPHGFGAQLSEFRDVVYSDNACEVWHMRRVDVYRVRAPLAHGRLPHVGLDGCVHVE